MARVSWVWDGGAGWGADSDATRGLGPPPQPPPRPGRDRSLLLRPHYRGVQPGLAEEPDGCRGRWGGLPAPWPGLNIYYVLFGLWGRGRRAVASIPSCRRGGARRRGLGSHSGPRTPASLGGPGREPRTPENPLPGRPLSGRGFAAETLGRGDRSGLPRGSDGPPWKRFPPRGRLGQRPGRGRRSAISSLAHLRPARRPQPGSETAAGAPVWSDPTSSPEPAALAHCTDVKSEAEETRGQAGHPGPSSPGSPSIWSSFTFPPKAAPCRRPGELPAPAWRASEKGGEMGVVWASRGSGSALTLLAGCAGLAHSSAARKDPPGGPLICHTHNC